MTLARTIFLGSGAFAVPIVEALSRHPATELVAVVSAPARPGSRGRLVDPPVASWAIEHDIPLLRPVRLRAPDAIDEIRALGPGLLVLADYGQIVPQALLDVPLHGALNVHPSLLPRHRGAAPIPAAILAGDVETGVSLMRMDAGLDSGPLLGQRRVALTGAETASQLERSLADMGAELLVASLGPWLRGEIEPSPQPGDGVTLTRPLHRADGRLNPGLDAHKLERQVRAYQPWPGSFIETVSGRVIVWRAAVLEHSASLAPGVLASLDGGRLGLVAAPGLLELLEVQPAGGRRMSGVELLRGRPALAGSAIT